MAEEAAHRRPSSNAKLRGAWASILTGQSGSKRLSLVLERGADGRYEAAWRSGEHSPRRGLARRWSATRRLALQTSLKAKKEAHDVVVALDAADDGGDKWRPPARTLYDGRRDAGGLSLLQSHLQKCVRRGHAALAARTAQELAAMRFAEDKLVGLDMLLRRLPVIAAEDDVAVDAIFTPLVWFMLAVAGGYELTRRDFAWLLAAVFAIAEPKPRAPDLYARQEYLLQVPAAHHGLALSLLARAAYGGMRGDVDLLCRAAHAVVRREEETNDDAPAPPPPPPLSSTVAAVNRLLPGDWIPEGVDFHCKHGEILAHMRGREPELLEYVSDEELTAWMWRFRSSVNVRDRAADDPPPAKAPRLEPPWAARAHALADQCARDIIQAAYKPSWATTTATSSSSSSSTKK